MTGLKVNTGVASGGGLSTQALKTGADLAADVASSAPTPINIVASTHGVTAVAALDAVKLQPSTSRRAGILAARGVNVMRPEVVVAARFEPAYSGEAGTSRTPAGDMLDVQMVARNVRVDNINAFLEELRTDPVASQHLMELETAFTDQFDQARADTTFMSDAFGVVDTALARLDVRRNVDRMRVAADGILGGAPDVLDIRDIFVGHMGFSAAGFESFTNTKVFGQLAFDIAAATRRYTPGLFGIVDSDRPSDVDPYRFDRTATTTDGRFSFDVADFGDFEGPANAFDTAFFNRFVDSLPEGRDDRMKLLSATMSRLLSVSSALGTKSVQADLRRLNVPDDADDPIVDVMGVPGQSVMDEPDGDGSVVNLTRIVADDDSVVLPLERRYIVDRAGRRFMPGDDYFFDGLVGSVEKFDITRLSRYERAFERRIDRAMNVVEAAARVDTPYVQRVYGSLWNDLRARRVYDAALGAAAEVLAHAVASDGRARNFLFILAAFEMSRVDRRIRHLLFQLTALTVMYNNVMKVGSERVELVSDMRDNEAQKFGDFPALLDYIATLPTAQVEGTDEVGGVALAVEQVDVGATSTSSPARVIESAFRQVQRLMLDAVFGNLASRTNLGYVGSLTTPPASFAGAPTTQQSFNAQLVGASLGSVGSGGTSLQFDRPDFVQTFDDDMRFVLFRIARFVDEFEDVAGRGGTTGRVRRRAHVLRDGSGRSRYMRLSSSARMMLGFELMATALGAFDLAKFSGVDVAGDTATITYSKTRVKTMQKAGIVSFAPIVAALMASVVGDQRRGLASAADAELVAAYTSAQQGSVDDTLYADLDREFNDVRSALTLDGTVLRSMTSNLRAMAVELDDAVDAAQVFFDAPQAADKNRNSSFVIAIDPSQVAALVEATWSSTKAATAADTDRNEKQARKALMSRQQVALALMRLHDIEQLNVRVGPGSLLASDATGRRARRSKDVFNDASRVTLGVQGALWSMLSDARFRGDDGGVLKLLSVGVPAGFVDRLEDGDVVDVPGRGPGQLDMVTVDVYRRDLIEEDIVFKPMKLLFEASRFVTAASFDDVGLGSAGEPMKFDALLADRARMFDASTFDGSVLVGQTGDEFVESATYDFMSRRARREVVRNHVVSYLLSVYLRMMTGIDVGEYSFLVEPDAVVIQSDEQTSEAFIAIADRVAELSGTGTTLQELRTRNPELDRLFVQLELGEFQPGVLQQSRVYDRMELSRSDAVVSDELTDLAKLGGSRSMLTGGRRLRRSITSPKLFERVFNVAVDPFSFEVDVEATKATTSGRLALARLRSSGRLVDAVEGGRSVVRLSRVVKGDDVVLDQYFTTLSRYRPTTLVASTNVQAAIPVTALNGFRMNDVSAVKRFDAARSELSAATAVGNSVAKVVVK